MGDYQHPLFTAFRGTRCKPLITLSVQYFSQFNFYEQGKNLNKIILDLYEKI